MLSATPSVFAGMAIEPSPKDSTGAPLNQTEIHNQYNEGNFENVIALIDSFQRSHKTYSHADSIFIAKHLAVVYSANPESREKGRYYMYRLLELMPSAELVDMFVSDEIDRIFERVRREFMARQRSFGIDTADVKAPAHPSVTPSTPPVSKRATGSDSGSASEPKRRFTTWMWAALGGGSLAAGGLAFYVYESTKTGSGSHSQDWEVTVRIPQE